MNAPQIIVGYKLIDDHTKAVIAEYGPDKRKVASRRADKLDAAYGSYRYVVQPVFRAMTAAEVQAVHDEAMARS